MTWPAFREDDTRDRPSVGLAVGFVLFAVVVALALFFAVRTLLPGGEDRIDLSLYNSNEDGTVSAQVQYTCGSGDCGETAGDRLFFEVGGAGASAPESARVGSTDIQEAVIREREGGLLVYFSIPPGEPGYSVTVFPCSSPGEDVSVKATLETGDGADQTSSHGTVACPES